RVLGASLNPVLPAPHLPFPGGIWRPDRGGLATFHPRPPPLQLPWPRRGLSRPGDPPPRAGAPPGPASPVNCPAGAGSASPAPSRGCLSTITSSPVRVIRLLSLSDGAQTTA